MPDMADAAIEVTIVANDVGGQGGMERQLTELITGLLAAGSRVTVISWSCALPSHPNLRWHRVFGPSRPFPIAYPWFLIAASLLVRLRGRGLIHSTGAIVLNRTDVCTVHFCHRAVAKLPRFSRASRASPAYRLNAAMSSAISRLGERWCYGRGHARRLVGVSLGVARELEENYPQVGERVTVIPNGVDTEIFRPMEEEGAPERGSDGLRALFVGSEWERKGLSVAIEALRDAPGVSLTVVGEGDLDAYGKFASQAGVADRVEFVGTTSDVAGWFRLADAFVLPTAYETFSLVSYEAAASGLPLLVTRVNGVEDLLRDGENGWFIERDAADVTAKMRLLRDDHGLQRRMGKAARLDSLRFSWKHVVDEYRALYAAVSG
jgi:glycosyltransferase involved in cell wall biosynthesis